MKRRHFIACAAVLPSVASGIGVWARTAVAQSDANIPHIGILDTGSPGQLGDLRYWDAFRAGMRALGYSDGKNIVFDYRWANDDYRRLPGLAAELVKLRVKVIVATSTPVIIAARSATTELPIVAARMADPVGSGFAQTLARPGGNITGLSTLSAELAGKRLEQLKEIVPSMSRAGMLWDANVQSFALTVQQTESAARSLGLSLDVRGVRTSGDVDAALATIKAAGAQGIVIAIAVDSTVTGGDPASLCAAIARYQLPASYLATEFIPTGGLVSYGPSYADLFRRAAAYVDKILKGAKPADLPVEQPNVFELGVNLKTARALGLAVPQSILVRADEVIE